MTVHREHTSDLLYSFQHSTYPFTYMLPGVGVDFRFSSIREAVLCCQASLTLLERILDYFSS